MSTFLQDLRYGARMLRRTPAFTSVVIVVLALGVGANTAIFSVVNAVLLKPLPYHEPARLYQIQEVEPDGERVGVSAADLHAFLRNTSVFETGAISRWHNATLTGPEGAENVFGARASNDFFTTLGVHPAIGRRFRSEEFRTGAPGVVVLSDRLWRHRYAGNPGVIGRQLMLDGAAFIIVGVMPQDFFYDRRYEFWIPWQFTAEETENRKNRHQTVVRLKSGITRDQASAETEAVLRNVATDDFGKGWRIRIANLHDQVTSSSRTALLTILGAVGFVLLIACINVANMLLARGSDRMREMSIRAALGASRARAFRQMLTESFLLATAGGAVGLLLAWVGTRALVRYFPERMPIPRFEHTRLDWEVLAFTLGVSIVTGVLFGLVPAIQASRTDIGEALKMGTRGAGSGKGLSALRNGLILVETALSVILLVGAGLMLRSFSRLMNSDFGFHPDRVLTMRVPVPFDIKEKPQQIAYYTRLLAQVEAIPGLNSAGIIAPLPLAGVDANQTFGVRGRPAAPGESPVVKLRSASPGFFAAMRLNLVSGRVFNESDIATAPPVVVVSNSLARRYFAGENPIGKQVGGSSGEGPWFTVIGVVRDVKHTGLSDENIPELYHPYQQYIFFPFITTLVIRTTASDPGSIASSVQKQIRAMNPDQPINDVLPMTEVVSRSAAQPRFYTLVLGIFAAVALVLAAAGLYGVLSYAVSQRVREIGIRVALGAPTRSIIKEVVGNALLIVFGGIVLGVGGAYALSRVLATQLYQIAPTDPATYAIVCILIACVAAAAAWLPTRRATRVDPSIALRCD